MARNAIAKESYRTLFAKTGNQCTFPGCTHPLVDGDGDFIAQICHIQAASPKGQRFNPDMTDKERAHPSNLMVLCYPHHVKTNNVDVYTVDVLTRMKADHERIWSERPYEVPEDVFEKIYEDEISFWREIEISNSQWVDEFDLAIPVVVDHDPKIHLKSILSNVARLNELIDILRIRLNGLPEEISSYLVQIGMDPAEFDKQPYYENPFWNIEWEMLHIGVPNWTSHIRCNAMVLRVFLIFQALKATPNDRALIDELQAAKDELMEFAKTAIYVD